MGSTLDTWASITTDGYFLACIPQHTIGLAVTDHNDGVGAIRLYAERNAACDLHGVISFKDHKRC